MSWFLRNAWIIPALPAASFVVILLLGGLGVVLQRAFKGTHVVVRHIDRTSDIGVSIFRDFVVPFEVASVLLLAALVGAVVIARRD